MVVSAHWRTPVLALIGAGAYLTLLTVTYGILAGSYSLPPQWWLDHLHQRPLASASWFVLINAVGAISAAIPVAVGVVLCARTQKLAMSLLIGVPPSLYIMGSALFEYGLPKYVTAWVVDAFQLFSISLAVLSAVWLFSSIPLTIGSSDRGSHLR